MKQVQEALKNLGIPVTLSLSYEEFLHVSGKRSATYTNAKLAADFATGGKKVPAELWDELTRLRTLASQVSRMLEDKK